jgi:hypothetical protein
MSDMQERATHRRSIPSLLLEVLMIVIGVFLGASAEQLRETRHHHELATASLRNFRREVATNRARVAEKRDYHIALGKGVTTFINAPGKPTLQRLMQTSHFTGGFRPIDFDHTAWDLALATQSLPDIEPRLAYTISRVYTTQESFQIYQREFLSNALAPTAFANIDNVIGLGIAMAAYFGDVNVQEPQLLQLYDLLLPKLDSALGGPPPAARATPKVDSSKPTPAPAKP